MVYLFEYLHTDQNGRRRRVDSASYKLASVAEAKMLAAGLLKHTTFLGINADVALIKDQAGRVLCEVEASTHAPKKQKTIFQSDGPEMEP